MHPRKRDEDSDARDVREAQVIYDSSCMDGVTGVRGGGSEEHRVLLYEATGFSLDLVLHSSGDTCDRVYGQVISGLAGEPVRDAKFAWQGGSVAASSGRFGEFALSGPPSDTPWVLCVDTGSTVIECAVP